MLRAVWLAALAVTAKLDHEMPTGNLWHDILPHQPAIPDAVQPEDRCALRIARLNDMQGDTVRLNRVMLYFHQPDFLSRVAAAHRVPCSADTP